MTRKSVTGFAAIAAVAAVIIGMFAASPASASGHVQSSPTKASVPA